MGRIVAAADCELPRAEDAAKALGGDDWAIYQDHRQLLDKEEIDAAFVITPDHGRGSGPVEWRNHGAAVEGAENIWLAILGPDTPPLGERTDTEAVFQNQIAATLAALLGEDYGAAVPKAGSNRASASAAPPRAAC